MAGNQVNIEQKQRSGWLDFIALLLAFFGSVASIAGALALYSSQAQFSEVSLWPLPGLYLVVWGMLGLLGFIAAYLTFRVSSLKWLLTLIFITGMFIPLIILGALSIGTLVAIGFLFFVISTLILAIRKKASLLESLSLFLLGAICNLGLLLIIITLGKTA